MILFSNGSSKMSDEMRADALKIWGIKSITIEDQGSKKKNLAKQEEIAFALYKAAMMHDLRLTVLDAIKGSDK